MGTRLLTARNLRLFTPLIISSSGFFGDTQKDQEPTRDHKCPAEWSEDADLVKSRRIIDPEYGEGIERT